MADQILQPVTPETVEAAKAQFKEKRLRKIAVTTNDGSVIEFLLKKPNRNVIEAVSRVKNDLTATNKIFLANCVIAGDSDALENDGDVYGEVMKHIAKFMNGASSEIKKL